MIRDVRAVSAIATGSRTFDRGWCARVCALGIMVLMAACGARNESEADRRGELPASERSDHSDSVGQRPSPSDASWPRIVILGDSLTAGLGLSATEAYPTLLKSRLEDDGLKYTIVNAGVSGDTSAGGLSRLEWALDGDVRVLIVALGGNDALRGLPPEQLAHNLSDIIEQAKSRGIAVILAGMEAPPNYGRDYTVAFHRVYPALAKKYQIPLIPFLLQGVAGVESLNQRDGIHPTARGAQMVADNVWAALKPVVEQDARHPPVKAGLQDHAIRGEGSSNQ
jgi:acyl-CoA thioesterase-1